jgi:excisionase family DNA binding protein
MPQTRTPIQRSKRPKPTPTSRPVALAAEVLTLDEAAAYLRVSSEEVDGLASRGDLPGRKIGEQWRFHRSALVEWLSQPSPAERLMRHAGAAKDDPYRDELPQMIAQNRRRHATEAGS